MRAMTTKKEHRCFSVSALQRLLQAEDLLRLSSDPVVTNSNKAHLNELSTVGGPFAAAPPESRGQPTPTAQGASPGLISSPPVR